MQQRRTCCALPVRMCLDALCVLFFLVLAEGAAVYFRPQTHTGSESIADAYRCDDLIWILAINALLTLRPCES